MFVLTLTKNIYTIYRYVLDIQSNNTREDSLYYRFLAAIFVSFTRRLLMMVGCYGCLTE